MRNSRAESVQHQGFDGADTTNIYEYANDSGDVPLGLSGYHGAGKKGRPVVKELTKDDFTITENKKPQWEAQCVTSVEIIVEDSWAGSRWDATPLYWYGQM